MENINNLLSFLRYTVAEELRKFPKEELEYYAFLIIMQAIEVTGSLFDTKSIDEYGECENRFKNGFEYLFPEGDYAGKWKMFFEQLRGPIVHQLRPRWDFTLSCERKLGREKHFQQDQQFHYILILEVLIDDLEAGFDRLIKESEDGLLDGKIDKTKLNYSHIITYNPVNASDLYSNSQDLSASSNYKINSEINVNE